MPVSVPITRTRASNSVPPAGRYVATVARVETDEDTSGITFWWAFRAERRDFTLGQTLAEDDALEILVDLGLAGQTVEWEDAAGRRAIIDVRTFGGRTSAGVVDVRPYVPPQ
ncbi:MAG: hypothetical protein OXE76_04025 [Alphaproteobacteria bacterium]|nr:hypothetical protein [Alphaproteobacteria bacterium]